MSALLRPRCVCSRPSGLSRHARPAAVQGPSFRTGFRVTLVAVLLLAGVFWHWITWAAGWLLVIAFCAALYAADLIGL